MTPPSSKEDAMMDAEVREKIHLEILKRTGAYHANDHILLPSGQHTSEYIEKTLVTTEASFTEGLGAVIAKHFAPWPIDVILSTGPGALILSHCVARAHPSRPILIYGTKGVSGGKRRVTLPAEFHRLIRTGRQGAHRRRPGQLRHDGPAPDPARGGPRRSGRRHRRALAPHEEGRDRRQGDLQPGEPRFPDVSAGDLPALQEGRAPESGVREAPGAPQALLGAKRRT